MYGYNGLGSWGPQRTIQTKILELERALNVPTGKYSLDELEAKMASRRQARRNEGVMTRPGSAPVTTSNMTHSSSVSTPSTSSKPKAKVAPASDGPNYLLIGGTVMALGVAVGLVWRYTR